MSIPNFYDELKQVVDDKINAPDVLVSNLHGADSRYIVGETARGVQEWYALAVETPSMPTLPEFFNRHTDQRLPHSELSGQGQITVLPSAPGTATLLLTNIVGNSSQTIPLEIDAPGYEYNIYLGTNRIRTGRGTTTIPLALSPGEHILAIILRGGQEEVTVALPSHITCRRIEPIPAPPIIVDEPEAYYFDEGNGSFEVALEWLNDATASGWQVYRTEALPVGKILSAIDIGEGIVRLEVNTSVDDFTIGERVHTKHWFAGTIVEVGDDTPPGGPQIIDVLPASSSPETLADWIGKDYLRPDPTWTSPARIGYAGTSSIRWLDSSVRRDRVYIYRVTAFGAILGGTESDYSSEVRVLVQDTSPPGNVTIKGSSVKNGIITVDYRTPSDPDYKGVRIYYANPDTNEDDLVITDLGTVDTADQISFVPLGEGDYWFRTFDWAGNEQSEGVALYYDGNPNDGEDRGPQPGIFVRAVPDWGTGMHEGILRLDLTYGTDTKSVRVQYTYASVPGQLPTEKVDYTENLPPGRWKFLHIVADKDGYTPREWPTDDLRPPHITLTPYSGSNGTGTAGPEIIVDPASTEPGIKLRAGDLGPIYQGDYLSIGDGLAVSTNLDGRPKIDLDADDRFLSVEGGELFGPLKAPDITDEVGNPYATITAVDVEPPVSARVGTLWAYTGTPEIGPSKMQIKVGSDSPRDVSLLHFDGGVDFQGETAVFTFDARYRLASANIPWSDITGYTTATPRFARLGLGTNAHSTLSIDATAGARFAGNVEAESFTDDSGLPLAHIADGTEPPAMAPIGTLWAFTGTPDTGAGRIQVKVGEDAPKDVNQLHFEGGVSIDGSGKATFTFDSRYRLASQEVPWGAVSKTGSSLAHLASRSISDTTGTLAITRGGTGLSSNPGASGRYLRSSSSTTVAWSTIPFGDLPTGTSPNTIAVGDHTHDDRYTRMDTTNLGKVGSVSMAPAWTTSEEWSDQPVGYSQMLRVGTAGAPLNNYGYFQKVANRNVSGGWGGLWVGYAAGQNYMGRASTRSEFADWDLLWSDKNFDPTSKLNVSGGTLTGNLSIAGQNLIMLRPDTEGGWARGMQFHTTDSLGRYGAVGMYGSGTNPKLLYMAFGADPHASGTGVYVGTDGKVGIGKTNPAEHLDVVGTIRADDYKDSYNRPLASITADAEPPSNARVGTLWAYTGTPIGGTGKVYVQIGAGAVQEVDRFIFQGGLTISGGTATFNLDGRYLQLDGSNLTSVLGARHGIDVSVLSGKNATDPYSAWPTGFSLRPLSSDTGWPQSTGIVLNFNHGAHRSFQLFQRKDTTRLHIRSWHQSNANWTDWAELETVGHTHATLTRGTGLTGSNYNGGSATTWGVDFGTGSNQVARGNHTHTPQQVGALPIGGGTLTGRLTLNPTSGQGTVILYENGYIDISRGSHRLRLNANYGNSNTYAHIGTTTALPLRIGAGAGNNYAIHISLNNDVGIGTTSPTERLHVSGTAKATNFVFENANNGVVAGILAGDGTEPPASARVGSLWAYTGTPGGGGGGTGAVQVQIGAGAPQDVDRFIFQGGLTISGGTATFNLDGRYRLSSASIPWADVTKTGSSLAHLATRNISDTTGTLAVNRGGTGRTSITAGNLLVGAGTSAPTLLAPGSSGGYVRSNGSAWVRSTIQFGDLPTGTTSNTVAVGNHTHTAAQVGALPIGGGTLTGDLKVGSGTDGVDLRTNGIAYIERSGIRLAFNANYGTGGYAHIYTANQVHPMRIGGSGSSSYAIAIDTQLRVGIGTTSPAVKLHVSGAARADELQVGANGQHFHATSTTLTGLQNTRIAHVIHSSSAPSGTAPEGTLWVRYS